MQQRVNRFPSFQTHLSRTITMFFPVYLPFPNISTYPSVSLSVELNITAKPTDIDIIKVFLCSHTINASSSINSAEVIQFL